MEGFMKTGYDKSINYDYDYQYAAEFLDEQLGRNATDAEIQEFIEIQEARILDAFEYTEER